MQSPHPARKILGGPPKRAQSSPFQKMPRGIALALRGERERAQQVMLRTGVSALGVPLEIDLSALRLAIEQGGGRRQAKDDRVTRTGALGLRCYSQKPQFPTQVCKCVQYPCHACFHSGRSFWNVNGRKTCW